MAAGKIITEAQGRGAVSHGCRTREGEKEKTPTAPSQLVCGYLEMYRSSLGSRWNQDEGVGDRRGKRRPAPQVWGHFFHSFIHSFMAALGLRLGSHFYLSVYLSICLSIYLFMAALGLRCWVRAFSSCGEQGLLFVAVRGLLIAVASPVAEHGL